MGRAHLPLPTPLGDARFGLVDASKWKMPKSQMTGAPTFQGMECLLEGHCASGWGEKESDAALELACKKWGAKVRGLKT